MTVHTAEISVKGKWVRVPALEVEGRTIIVNGKWIKVALIDAEEWLETGLEDPEPCLKKLKEQRSSELRADLFTFAQRVSNPAPRYKYPMEMESIAAVRLTTFDNWWQNLPQETRKNTRRSQKRGVVVRVQQLDASLIKDILTLNNDSSVRQGKPFSHYGKTLEQVTKDQAAFLDRSEYICAYLGDELVGFAKLVFRKEVASILTFLPKASHYDKRPANALMTKLVERCTERQISYLTYGLFNYGNKQDAPLREFKVRNGFGEILVPRFYVPLTVKGALCMKLNLHRGLIGILPPSVIALGGKVRTKWYNTKLSMRRCSSMTERPNRTRQMECSNPPAGSNS